MNVFCFFVNSSLCPPTRRTLSSHLWIYCEAERSLWPCFSCKMFKRRCCYLTHPGQALRLRSAIEQVLSKLQQNTHNSPVTTKKLWYADFKSEINTAVGHHQLDAACCVAVKTADPNTAAANVTDWTCQTCSWPRLWQIRGSARPGTKAAALHWTSRPVWYSHGLKAATSAENRQSCLTGQPQRNSL